jgi:hypothetical protein
MDEIDAETQGKLDAARAANPTRSVVAANSSAGWLILGSPTRQQYLQYRILLRSEIPMDNARAIDELLMFCAINPSAVDVRGLLERYPALAGCADVGAALAELSGSVTKK